ncbi:endoplasmic reticulum-Golgi intermediate compartment protein 2-like [Saccoglossus kowalevskii]|uniref:Endoplasmic reticulum-Golgi intermediate compartment protein 2-like n=1 Tax=Saccoglossus kowalevskii TaxID=10224 RepID=A0ABM0GS59_SACKO|nr:PREDICTED: endoplasmic reticulum-Golgi intermediate compartment protein 2-like [Saccoglossus kowalevskii]
MMLRRRKQTLKVVKELDAFPKIPENYQETTATGGTVSILTFSLIAILVISEIQYYSETTMKYEYEVDTDLTSKLRLNIDITVAMKCDYIGADVLDMTGDTVSASFGSLKEQAVHFELSRRQKQWQKKLQAVRSALANEHAIQDLLFKVGFDGSPTSMPEREDKPAGAPNSCRIHGSMSLNKVAGNFHITLGKSIPHPRGHAHLAAFISQSQYNFSHRIDHFSFGVPTPGIVNPLDGDQRVTQENARMYQYFIQIVPTRVNTRRASADTHQYAVTERDRVISHSSGSHGVAGIFFKYDLSSVSVKVTEEYQPYWQFLVRLCGIIGGVFATSGMLHSLIGCLYDLICCKYQFGKYKPKEHKASTVPVHHLRPSGDQTTDEPSVNFVLQTQQEVPMKQ